MRAQMPDCPQPSTARGFTLIEVMVVMAIVAILGALAYPSYTEYTRKGARAEARVALLETQQFMERYYAANSAYVSSGGSAPTLPTRLATLPSDGSPARYLLSVAASVGAYTLTATPQGNMAADKCGALLLTNTNVRSMGGTGVTVADCWK